MFLIIGSSILLRAQKPIIIDHNCIDLSEIPIEWIESAKAKLFIGYGHTSHGSQLTSGMNAIESYYSDGTFNWSHTGGDGELHLFEGSSYDEGYLDHDVGYSGWDDKTRVYLDSFPECNVIMWSWCGQVNDVDLLEHYLLPMEQLEDEYPDVKFVYMTGHLEGGGPTGSLFEANQQIREHCDTYNKILFDFADIEKYSPNCDTNYQEYYCDDHCDYVNPDGDIMNWANNWLANNPDHELTQISQICGSCAHSISLNCVKKGIACWYLWAKLAGWNNDIIPVSQISIVNENDTMVLTENNSLQLDVNVLPQNATNKKVEWKAENITGQAIVDFSGLVSAIAQGDVRIKVISEDNPNARDSVLIRIIESVIHVDSISIYNPTELLTVYEDSTLQLDVNVLPQDATDKKVEWKAENITGQAIVDFSGLVSAIAQGDVRIKVISEDNPNARDSVLIRIIESVIHVDSVSIYSPTGLLTVYEDNTLQLAVNIYPEDASDTIITWRISNFTGEAIIDSLGNLLAISEGIVIVIARSNDESNSIDYVPVDILKNTANLNQSFRTKKQLIIYPNPSNGELFIYVDAESRIEAIEIINLSGLIVFKMNDLHNNHNSVLKLNLLNLYKGIYYINIIYSNHTYITQPILIK